MGLFTELRHSITRLWGRTEQVVGEAYGNEALEYEGEADEAKADEADDAHHHGPRHEHQSHGSDGAIDPDDDGTASTPAR